ncbi:hypothetical protein MKW94_005523 [Papaver nudicaule]|uniref:Uncharacterized protein n=1 Tax=Papaver nudicaule TaxID=74823 RepID=A0AA42AYK5_PAPNU|nr:hypothetical protein [Papaver nudicaule]MCL7043876.1 hypothetical protein [Papaver nudicaule]
MALIDVAKILFLRFSTTTNNGSKHAVIRDERLRRACERLEEAAEKAKRLKDECDVNFAIRNAFPTDRIIWIGFIMNLADLTIKQLQIISKTREKIKDKAAQLSALRAKERELQLPA